MELITHIAVLVFTVVVILGVGAFVVIDMFGRVDYLKDKAPWLKKALERREALGVLLVVAIFLVIGDGYELTNKEVPAVPAAPTVEIKGPRAPDISKCEIVRVAAPGAEKTQSQPAPQTNLPEKVCPPPTVVYQSAPGTAPSQLDRLIAANKNLPKGDRERLAEAFFEYSKFLDQGQNLFYQFQAENGEIQHARQGGSISKNWETHLKKLQELKALAWSYAKALPQLEDKWKYYPEQTYYVFGQNDNLGPYKLINAAGDFAIFLERWSKIQNKDQQEIVILIAEQGNSFNTLIQDFIHWQQGSLARLEEMKRSIQ
jgi:hypothetical protein